MTVSDPAIRGAVLAGGLGSRLGGVKAAARLGGRPLISYPVAALAGAGIEATVIAKSDVELPALDCARLDEPTTPRHPLCGIVAALDHAARQGGSTVIVLACDMPLLPASLLGWLAGLDDPLAVPLVDGHAQPLAGRYDISLLPALRQALDREPGPLTEIVADLGPRLLNERELARFGNPRRMLHNVNTTADLERAEQLLGVA